MIRLDEDHYRYESKLFDWAALVLLGYFLWDFFICIRQVDYFGKTFILHAVVSLAANWALLYAEELRTSWLAAALIATEISTPFLHLRWFLLQGKCRGWYLQIVNVVFLIAFVGYRLIAVELLAIFPFTKELLNWPQKEGTSPPLRLIFEGVIAWVWMLLNYYWGALLCYTQYKQLNKYFAKPEPVRPHGE